MAPRCGLIGLVVRDPGWALASYRRLGLAIPRGGEGEPRAASFRDRVDF